MAEPIKTCKIRSMLLTCALDFVTPRRIGNTDIHERLGETWPPGKVEAPTLHRVQLLLRGRQQIETRFGTFDVKRGAFFLFLKGESYTFRQTSPIVRSLSLYLDPLPGDACLQRPKSAPRSSPTILRVPAFLPPEMAGGLSDAFFALHQLTLRRSSAGAVDERRRLDWMVDAETRRFLLLLSDRLDPAPDETEGYPLHVRRITQMLTRHPETFQTMEEAAAIAGVPVSTLRRHFKESTGRSLKQFHLEARVNRSRELLAANQRLSLAAVAERVGFSDEYHLSRVFKKLTGVTPSEYRRKWLVAGDRRK